MASKRHSTIRYLPRAIVSLEVVILSSRTVRRGITPSGTAVGCSTPARSISTTRSSSCDILVAGIIIPLNGVVGWNTILEEVWYGLLSFDENLDQIVGNVFVAVIIEGR